MEREHIDGKTCCYLHPEELMIGVCALCLHQKLLVLAKKQHNKKHKSSSSVSSIYLHKVFAFGSLLDRKRKTDQSTTAASISQQESFISINLEDNSIASSSSSSWEKKEIVGKAMIKSSSVGKHRKPRSSHVRWPNRIGHWLKLIAWNK